MSKLFDDILTPDEIAAIDAVHLSNSTRFDVLVRLADLDPSKDFRFSQLRSLDLRGADLSGFDFSGSDLRLSIIDQKTIIDESTILDDAKVNWIEEEALPIVQHMQEIEATSSSEMRLQLIKAMVGRYGRTKHVVDYMVQAAIASKEVETYLDFVTNLPVQVSPDQLELLSTHGSKLLVKKFKRTRRRTRRDSTANFAVEPIVKRLRESPGGFGAFLFGHLAKTMDAKSQTIALNGMALPEPQDLLDAFGQLSAK